MRPIFYTFFLFLFVSGKGAKFAVVLLIHYYLTSLGFRMISNSEAESKLSKQLEALISNLLLDLVLPWYLISQLHILKYLNKYFNYCQSA